MAEIRVPTLGESVTEATIGKWFKKPGEAVAVDEPLVELETDKVTIEVPAPAAGVLSDIAAKDGETVAVGALLGQIKEGAGAARCPARARPRRPAAGPEDLDHGADQRRRRGDQAARAAEGDAQPRARTCRWRRRCAASRRNPAWTPAAVAGSGKDGRVTKGDMMAAIERAASAPTPVARPPPRCRSARRRRPTMLRARSA